MIELRDYDLEQYCEMPERCNNCDEKDDCIDNLEMNLFGLIDILYLQKTEISNLEIDDILSNMIDNLRNIKHVNRKMPSNLPEILRKVS